ncbi:ABC transporter permease EscB [Fictibacillus macauensis ZFHKF-1]|uniref:ABC transporter permease EscB n=1 Tax=Fictibacillus macauensis ZFHKF-1 TaxID=1196324 RepID=I8UB53_9BACL|nr:ABC transporter permease [Fictibacillus macauensis]EIT84008.1 ABC transporter permease EscB [Fictibacillus macauensis ZFHKF-1]
MNINTLWTSRVQEFYRKIFGYYSIIGANVIYFLLIISSVFIYYLHLFLQWIPPQIPVEAILSLFITLILLPAKVRTFIKRADIVFLLALEWKLQSYFIRSIVYSFVIDAIKLLSIVIIFISLFLQVATIHLFVLIFIVGIVFYNILMKWTEQWLENHVQYIFHRLIRVFSLYFMCYFALISEWIFGLILMGLCFIFLMYFIGKKRTVNWNWLISEEESALLRNYKFINNFMDVPNLRRSFRNRRLLAMIVKRCIPYSQSSTFLYLYSLLFVRYNDYFYLYLRLTVIGIFVNVVIPTSGWFFTFLIILATGFQILPLQHEIKQSVLLNPISTSQMNKSFLKVILVILYAQFFILYSVRLIHPSTATIYYLAIGILFVYLYVNFFVSKRVNVSRSAIKE